MSEEKANNNLGDAIQEVDDSPEKGIQEHFFVLFVIYVLAFAFQIWMSVLFTLLAVISLSIYIGVLTVKLKKLDRLSILNEYGKPFIGLIILNIVLSSVSLFFSNTSKGPGAFDFVDLYNQNGRHNLKAVYEALAVYSGDNEGRFPQEGWQGILFPDDPFQNSQLFENPGVILNPKALEMGEKSPGDMVLGFACYDGWGKTEVYDADVHKVGYRGFTYITSDGKIKFISKSHGKYLRWSLGGPLKPELNKIGIYAIYSIPIVIACFMLIYCWKQFVKYLDVVCVMFFVTGGVNYFLSALTGILYLGYDERFDHSMFFITGPIAAISYILLVSNIRDRLGNYSCIGWAVFCGIVTGILCSCSIHMLYKIYCFEYTYGQLVFTGIPFGIIVGMLLGLLSGAILNHKHNKQIAEIEAGNE